MATIHVRNVPDQMHSEIQKLAEQAGRSLTAEVIVLLGNALAARNSLQDQRSILDAIRRRRLRRKPSTVSSVELLRKDRER
jgi:plasmid stability protein